MCSPLKRHALTKRRVTSRELIASSDLIDDQIHKNALQLQGVFSCADHVSANVSPQDSAS
ncbi:hypothetical protein CXF82_03605 [Shewanella sp. GutDb-MelDb]|nr:hypothetical protein CXF82_03605 [Shewanella sp. GutDb-MelDb]